MMTNKHKKHIQPLARQQVFREPLVWQFSHARHHTDTDIVGRDPEADGSVQCFHSFIFILKIDNIAFQSNLGLPLLLHTNAYHDS